MNELPFNQKISPWLPQLPPQVWSLATAQFLSEVGRGFTLFSAPIFFVNQVGLSITAVGIGLGSGAIAGVIGRFLGGTLIDSTLVGRKNTILLSTAISAVATVVFLFTHNLPIFIIGNLLTNLGIALLRSAINSAIADLTTDAQRTESFATMGVVSSIGIGLGALGAGYLISAGINYRVMFALNGISWLVFFGVVYVTLSETYEGLTPEKIPGPPDWIVALGDRPMMVFIVVNIIFSTYMYQLQSILPLYLSNFVNGGGLSAGTIGMLFTWHKIFTALCQLPLTRWLNRFNHPIALTISMGLWGVGFGLIWVTGVAPMGFVLWAILALSIMGAAISAYIPAAAAFVAELAPDSGRGIYFSMYSQSAAIGYFIGPSLGGWALDRSRAIADGFWLAAAVSVGLGILILQYLQGLLQKN